MSGEAADTARRYREALRAGDLETAGALLAPDVELVLPRGRYAGRDAVRDYLGRQVPLDHLDVEAGEDEIETVNGHVLATSEHVWRWREGGEEAYRRRSRARITVEDGCIVRIEVEHLA